MQSTAPPGRQSRGEWETRARILQNMKSCGLSAPRSHEFPSLTAPFNGAARRRLRRHGAGAAAGGPAVNPPEHAA